MLKLKAVSFATDEEVFETSYLELQEELQMLLNPNFRSDENYTDLAKSVGSSLAKMARKISALVMRMLRILRNGAEKTFSRSQSIQQRWEKRLKNNLNRIDQEKFYEKKLKIVSYEKLLLRIDAVKQLHVLLSNISQICDSPVTSSDWRTPEFKRAYSVLYKIGFDLSKFSLTKSVSTLYDQDRSTVSVSHHGYSLDKLVQVVEKIKTLAQYADSRTTTKIEKSFVAYGESLSRYDAQLQEQGESSSVNREILEIRLARFWWATHFIKVAHQIAYDIMVDVLKLCKAAEAQIVND
jgi:DNA-binding Lrp family transcriptional regulator